MARPKLHSITLYVETDDEDEVERLANAIALAACVPHDELTDDHVCPTPWFVVTLYDDEDAEPWRELLNR